MRGSFFAKFEILEIAKIIPHKIFEISGKIIDVIYISWYRLSIQLIQKRVYRDCFGKLPGDGLYNKMNFLKFSHSSLILMSDTVYTVESKTI